MAERLDAGSVAKGQSPGSIKDPYLYGGVAAIVGVLGLIAGAVLLVLGNLTSGAILAGLGVVLLGAGFLMARRGR